MSSRSLLVPVTLICTLAIACDMAESRLGFLGGTGSGAGAGTGNAGPAGLSETRAAGFINQNGGVKRPNGGIGKLNHAAPVVAEVGSLSPGGGHGEGEEAARVSPLRVAGISSAQNGGVGTGSGTGTANLNLFTGQAGATGQGSGSSVGK